MTAAGPTSRTGGGPRLSLAGHRVGGDRRHPQHDAVGQYETDHRPPELPYARTLSNPEFLRQGSALVDFMAPSRIVIGTFSDVSGTALAKVQVLFETKEAPVLVVGIEDAEVLKNAANAFLALNCHSPTRSRRCASNMAQTWIWSSMGSGGILASGVSTCDRVSALEVAACRKSCRPLRWPGWSAAWRCT